ncbi:SPOSA6832_03165 [Sporobolomyces salmonicolor]|uniref:SPOSA6832_03165-mRNA-1:cds n=1 Tax=Sporidiobolus salmonicolor TaxID=5005 RepID=A0A0D6EPA8_SPOSA|nr:SPOSA6832_03165 [Sporobolomyces salmonicolor]
MSGPQDHPGAPASLSQAQISRILKSPIHIHIKRLVYSILALGVVGTLSAFVVIALSCIWGKAILREERWFIFHYVVGGIFSALWLVYSYVYLRDVKFLAWPDQLQIDSGWIMLAACFSVAFFFYIYGKMRTYGTADLFDASW